MKEPQMKEPQMKSFFVTACLICAAMSFSLYAKDEISERTKKADVLTYGLESDVTEMISGLIKDKDTSFESELHQIFSNTKNAAVREKILEYGAAVKDFFFEKFVLTVLEDPYDEKKSTVRSVLRYASGLEIKKAGPLIRKILESDNEDYYDDALSALGKTGGSEEALFLADFLKKDDLTVARKQAVMRSLGELKAIETWEALCEIAEDDDENTFVRMYAAEAIGNMKKKESIIILERLFQNDDPNIRTSAVKSLSNFNTSDVNVLIVDALKDNYYKVRLEAAAAAEINKITAAVPVLLFRAKNDPETAVKYASYKALASINTDEGCSFLSSLIADKKNGENSRSKAVAAVLEYQTEKCYEAIVSSTRESLKDEKLKNYRYAVGRELSKYNIAFFEQLCGEYIAHADAATQGTGLDIFAKNNYTALKETVKTLASAEKETAVSKKARFITETHQLFK